jgi:hypothetical protein
MSRVIRKQVSFDQELAEVGKIRTYRCDFLDTDTGLMPIYREVIMPNSLDQFDRTPWWQRKTLRQRRQKS